MKIGRIVSLERGPKRDVVVRITSSELFSAISEPAGVIQAGDIAKYEVDEVQSEGSYSFRLYVRLLDNSRRLFYAGVTQVDLALLLDEFEAALPGVPRGRANA